VYYYYYYTSTGDSAIIRVYICFNAHAQNCRISTSGLKSDVIIVFLNPDFVCDAGISAIREHLRQKLAYLCLHGFPGPFGPNLRFSGQHRGMGGAILTPQ